MDKDTIELALETVKASEGFRSFVYDDNTYPSVRVTRVDCYVSGGQYKSRIAGGTATIGYGETSITIIDKYWDKELTESEASYLLSMRLIEQYLKPALAMLPQVVQNQLNPNQKAAISSFVYNVGIEGWRKSTILSYIAAKYWDEERISYAFHLWDNPDGILNTRRQKEIDLFLTPWKGVVEGDDFVQIFVEGG